ncbi:MAG TPA: hypothetical protein VEX57_11610, partial [Microlunatus sp.]|nr:hypothetical protein [Microlunatus sp.]
GLIFLIGAGAALVSLVAVTLIKEVPLRSTISLTAAKATQADTAATRTDLAPVRVGVAPRRLLEGPVGAGRR